MARVHLLTVHSDRRPDARKVYLSLLEYAGQDSVGRHVLIEDPAPADVVLFAEIDAGHACEYVLGHPLVSRFPDKCFMYSTDWRVIPFLPGVYTALERSWYLPRRVRAGFYPGCMINPLVQFEPDGERDLLYSFMGDPKTAEVRRRLAAMAHPRGAVVDTSQENQDVMGRRSEAEHVAFWQRYVDLARRSQFGLCPRGMAPSSIRLFEMMCLGRAPVILSDEWVPPAGPDWSACSIRVAEKDAGDLPAILAAREGESRAMGLAARREWETWFSPPVFFDRVVQLCLEIKEARRLPERLARLSILPQLFRERNFREVMRALKNRRQ